MDNSFKHKIRNLLCDSQEKVAALEKEALGNRAARRIAEMLKASPENRKGVLAQLKKYTTDNIARADVAHNVANQRISNIIDKKYPDTATSGVSWVKGNMLRDKLRERAQRMTPAPSAPYTFPSDQSLTLNDLSKGVFGGINTAEDRKNQLMKLRQNTLGHVHGKGLLRQYSTRESIHEPLFTPHLAKTTRAEIMQRQRRYNELQQYAHPDKFIPGTKEHTAATQALEEMQRMLAGRNLKWGDRQFYETVISPHNSLLPQHAGAATPEHLRDRKKLKAYGTYIPSTADHPLSMTYDDLPGLKVHEPDPKGAWDASTGQYLPLNDRVKRQLAPVIFKGGPSRSLMAGERVKNDQPYFNSGYGGVSGGYAFNDKNLQHIQPISGYKALRAYLSPQNYRDARSTFQNYYRAPALEGPTQPQ